jgi:SAM-dependent methyltransferase
MSEGEVAKGYILATGAEEVQRLQLLNQLYGPGTERLLQQAGLQPGMAILDMGCGSGNISCWLGQQVSERGSVIGLDASPAQVEQAVLQAQGLNLNNVTFGVADIYAPGLPAGSFDLVYCRFVLMHLTRPLDALQQLQKLLKPGGRLVCEELDLTYFFAVPACPALSRIQELNLAISDRRGQHFRLGTTLFQLFLQLGFEQPEVSFNQPVALRGEKKRLVELSFAQFAPLLVAEGLSTPTEVKDLIVQIKAFAANPFNLLGMPRAGQVWGMQS